MPRSRIILRPSTASWVSRTAPNSCCLLNRTASHASRRLNNHDSPSARSGSAFHCQDESMRAELTYGGAFFDSQKDTSFISASIVIPRVLSLCNPKSVADFGCGVGTWVRALLDIGVSDVTGIDGDYVRDDLLVIPSERFVRRRHRATRRPSTENLTWRSRWRLRSIFPAKRPPCSLTHSPSTAASYCSRRRFQDRAAHIM